MKFQKQLLRPGRYRLADGRNIVFTVADCRQLAGRVNAMSRLDIMAPLVLEHRPSCVAMSRTSATAKLTSGVKGYLAGAVCDQAGQVSGLFDIDDPADVALAKRVRFVSCYIEPDAFDGTGRKWAGPSISHVALTCKPVVPQRDRFQPVALSQFPSNRGIALSLGDRKDSNMADNDLFDEGELAGDTGDAGNLSQLLDEIASHAKAAKSTHRGTPPDFLADHIDDLTAMRDWLKVFSEGGDPRTSGDQGEQQPEGTPTAETPLALSRRSTGGSRPMKESCASYILRKFNGITAKK